jgi:hypothetical protein
MSEGAPLSISSIETHLATYMVGRAGVSEITFCHGSAADGTQAQVSDSLRCPYHQRPAYHVRTHGRVEVIPEAEVVLLWLEE